MWQSRHRRMEVLNDTKMWRNYKNFIIQISLLFSDTLQMQSLKAWIVVYIYYHIWLIYTSVGRVQSTTEPRWETNQWVDWIGVDWWVDFISFFFLFFLFLSNQSKIMIWSVLDECRTGGKMVMQQTSKDVGRREPFPTFLQFPHLSPTPFLEYPGNEITQGRVWIDGRNPITTVNIATQKFSCTYYEVFRCSAI